MAEHAVQPLEQSLYRTYQWIDDVSAGLGTHDEEDGYHALRASLHAIRDRLSPADAAHIAAQLPIVLRGVYYEGWDPGDRPIGALSPDGFAARIGSELPEAAAIDPYDALRATVEVLQRRIPPGEVTDVLNLLPGEVEALTGAPAISNGVSERDIRGPRKPTITGIDWALNNLQVESVEQLQRGTVNVYRTPNIPDETKVVNLDDGQVLTFFQGQERPDGFFAEIETLERYCLREGIPLAEVEGQLTVSALSGEAGDPLHHPG